MLTKLIVASGVSLATLTTLAEAAHAGIRYSGRH